MLMNKDTLYLGVFVDSLHFLEGRLMSIAGIVLLALYIALFFIGKSTINEISFRLIVLTVCVSIFVNVGSSLLGLSYTNLSLYIVFAFIIVAFGGNRNFWEIRKSFCISAILLLACVFLGNVHTIVSNHNPLIIPFNISIDKVYHSEVSTVPAAFTDSNLIYFRWLIIFMVITFFCTKILDCEEKKIRLLNTIKYVFEVFFLIWTLEWLLNNFISSSLVRDFVYYFFGINDKSKTYSVIIRWGFYGFNGLFVEPAYITVMVVYYSILWKMKLKTWKDWFMLLWSFFVLVINGSTSGMMLIPFGLLITYKNCSRRISKTTIKVIGIVIVAALALGLKFYEKVSNVLNQVLININAYIYGGYFQSRSETSAAIRQYGNSIAYRAFLNRPLFGIGFGATRGYGILPGALACLGCLGVLSYMYFLASAFRTKMTRDNFVLLCILLLYSTTILSIWYLHYPLMIPLCVVMTFNSKWINEQDDIYAINKKKYIKL